MAELFILGGKARHAGAQAADDTGERVLPVIEDDLGETAVDGGFGGLDIARIRYEP